LKGEEEMVYNKLRYGTVFACSRCGSKRFVLIAKIEIRDNFELTKMEPRFGFLTRT